NRDGVQTDAPPSPSAPSSAGTGGLAEPATQEAPVPPEAPSYASIRLAEPAGYAIDIIKNTATEGSTALDTSVVLLDAEPVFRGLLDDLEAGVPTPQIARKFHDAFVDAIVQVAHLGEAAFGVSTVVLSGGVFMNRYLVEHAVPLLVDAGFTVAMNEDLPPNDGCVSFGQAVIASRAPSRSADG
ncbi:MAG: hydrogenase maturation protein HypF, partial [Eggerthellaceae bacterium]|nr:hydrogenase maturation protein HypF [Eggerthellaceae bacterium]